MRSQWGYVERLGDVPGGLRLLSAQARHLNGQALLETVVASTPSSNVIGWVSRMVLALCG